MFALLVGILDVPSAFALGVLFVCICVIVVTFLTKKSAKEVENELELAKMRLRSEQEMNHYRNETDRQYKIKQLDQNLITSHKAQD